MNKSFVVLAFVAVIVTACGTTPPAKLYTLGAEADAVDSIVKNAQSRRIELVSVRIPELWERPQIVLTKSASEVGISEFHRWAAPLKAEVPRVVARDLRRLLDTPDIWLRDDLAGVKADLRVQVTIERIEAIAGERVQVDAVWAIRSVATETVKVGRTTITEPMAGSNYDAVINPLRRALSRMTGALAKDISAMPD